MEMLNHLIFAFLCLAALAVLVQSQSQSGFISIDCGLSETSWYTDKRTGINYTSDATLTDAGVSYNISREFNGDAALEQRFLNVRSFPEGKRNCYTLKPARGNIKFLIRATFMYANYDDQGNLPSFDLFLGAQLWDSVDFEDASTIVTKEIIHMPQTNCVYVCLVNTSSGTPFMSSLELRPLLNSTYPTQSGSLLLYLRLDVGSTTNETIRFNDDVYDRVWSPYNRPGWTPISTSLSVDTTGNQFQAPSAVMKTAVIPANGSNSLTLNWETSDNTSQYYVYLYFAELQQDQVNNQTRQQYIYTNGKLWYDGPFLPNYLAATILYSTTPVTELQFSINKTEESPLPPILNALEIYKVKEFTQLLTNQQDGDAIINIKTNYGVKRSSWQGDPCAPKVLLWQGLNCSYDDYNPPRIISLSIRLVCMQEPIIKWNGQITAYISDLTSIQILNLTGNKLKGSVPIGLIERRDSGFLTLSMEGNPDMCLSKSCTKKKNVVVPFLASFLAVSVLVAALSILWILKTRNQGIPWNNGSLELKNRRFSYSDVVRVTDNFERIIGEGGFGTVYHGNLDDTQVAVKMLSPSSIQGYKQFQAEVELLMRVYHKNLTTLVGYCDDGTNMGLIYEFMANGNLESHLLDNQENSNVDILSWEGRLRIATEAAQGLEYLHSGCKAPIVHRDVKPTNILLNGKFQAKLADFGLSRMFPDEGRTHVSTTVAGTPGYLDPEYYTSNRLTDKSNVYSFGIVLLQIITSKPVIEKSQERTHIIQWASFMLAKGDIKNVVDPRLQGDYDINSVWKAVEVAMACVSQNSAKRPTMNQVVMELNECLAIEMDLTKLSNEGESKSSMESISLNLQSQSSPLAR
ncbi:hypothetical protein ACOSP7_030801 [Xanthoceras sorbifolium]